MKVLQINTVCGRGSTGRIATDLLKCLKEKGYFGKIAYGIGPMLNAESTETIEIDTKLEYYVHNLFSRFTDKEGCYSIYATKRLIGQIEEYKPDIIHLHNIHGHYINYKILFNYLKKVKMPVVWTFHDCWSFTGHCSHFAMVKCEQWKNHCSYCSQLRRYPACYAMSSVRRNFARKCAAFTGVANLTLITPSKWLADLVKQSFLKEYPVEVHYNTIDTTIFKPTPSDFRERYGLQDKIIVLGVANVWEVRKGLFDFYKLAEMLDDRYAIVLVGLSEKQTENLPKNIKGIQRTNSPKELAAIYTAAGVFVNPSVEEIFGMTPVEAQACSTPSIVYEDTACADVAEQNGNKVVPQDVNALYKAITGEKFMRGEKNHSKKRGCTIVAIPRTNSPQELAEIYTAADIFANPTYEDNYPTVNLEAQACGTKVVTYDTGGCRETLIPSLLGQTAFQ